MLTNVSSDQFEDLLRSLRLPFMLLDRDLKLVRISEEARAWDGRPAEELLGRNFFELWPRRLVVGPALEEVKASGKTKTVEFQYPTQAGVMRWGEASIHPWGEGIAIVTRDITDKKQMAKALEEAKHRYHLATSASEDVIYEWDIEAGVVMCNEAGVRYFGDRHFSMDWWHENLHPDDRKTVTESLQTALAGKGHWSGEYRLKAVDGSYIVFMERCFIVRDESGKAVKAFGAMVDLTEQKKARRELKSLQNDLIRIARNSAMGAMASTLAHEINQPLTAIIQYLGGCDRLLEAGSDRADVGEAIQMARQAAEKAANIIRRVRTMSVKGKVSKQRVCVPSAVPEALGLAMLGERQIAVETDIEDDLGVYADPVQFQQVLLNLVRNAIEAVESTPEPAFRIRAWSENGQGVVEVVDNGPGIPENERGRLFESFFTTKPDGAGIGLPISRTIVEDHGGSLLACDGDWPGACFVVRLPLVPESDKQRYAA